MRKDIMRRIEALEVSLQKPDRRREALFWRALATIAVQDEERDRIEAYAAAVVRGEPPESPPEVGFLGILPRRRDRG